MEQNLFGSPPHEISASSSHANSTVGATRPVAVQTTDYLREKERPVLLGWLLGAAVIGPDVVSVLLANSVMLLADLLKTISETLATFLSWVALRRLRQGKTLDYNYGQGKLENLSSLAVGGALFISWLVVAACAMQRFWHPQPIGNISLALFLTGTSLCTNLWIWRKNYQLNQVSPSPIVEAQWRLYRAKSATNVCVVVSMIVSVLFRGYRWAAFIDPVGAVVLSGVLLQSAYRVLTDSVHDLLDRALDESLQMIIMAELAARFHEYEALHGIRSRRSGTNIYIEIFLEFDGNRRMSEVQEIIRQICRSLEQKIKGSHVVIAPTNEPVV